MYVQIAIIERDNSISASRGSFGYSLFKRRKVKLTVRDEWSDQVLETGD